MNDENLVVQDGQEIQNAPANLNVPFADRCKQKAASISNPFVRVLFSFVSYIAIIFVDFFVSLKRNPSKIAGILIAAPGLFIGFLLGIQIDAVYNCANATSAPLYLFILVIAGAVNIFGASGVIKKRNLGSFIVALIVTIIVDVAGVLYFQNMIAGIAKSQKVVIGFQVSNAIIESFITIGISMLLSTVGCVIAFIFRNKNYVKDKI